MGTDVEVELSKKSGDVGGEGHGVEVSTPQYIDLLALSSPRSTSTTPQYVNDQPIDEVELDFKEVDLLSMLPNTQPDQELIDLDVEGEAFIVYADAEGEVD